MQRSHIARARLSVELLENRWAPAISINYNPSTEIVSIIGTLGNIKQIHALGGVFLAGQPNPDDLKLAKEKGLKTVINLREKGEIDWDEEAAVKSLGLEYVHLPFKSPETLTDDIFDRARKLLSDQSKHPVLLH